MILKEYNLISGEKETKISMNHMSVNLDWMKVYVVHCKNWIIMNVNVNIKN